MSRKLAFGIVALGILLRLVAVLSFPVYPLVANTADTAIYDEGARSLAAGHGYQWQGRQTAFFPVGWPLLLSLAYRTAGASARSGQLLNFLLSLALLAGAYGLARNLHGEESARWTVAVLALLPHQVIFPSFLMSEVAFTALFLASLRLVAAGTGRSRRLFAAGLFMGAATLVRGVALVYPLLVVSWARIGERRSWKRSVLAAVVFMAGMAVPLAPWAVRNHQVFGRWVIVANDGGMNFLMGNHPGATGARHEPAEGLPDTGDEVRDDREGYRRGLEFIRTHPGEFLGLLPRKLARLTAPAPLLTYRAELLAKWPRPLSWVVLGLDQAAHLALWLLFLLVAVRAVRDHWRHRREGGECAGDRGLRFAALAIGLWVLVHLAFLGGARYFFPVTPLLAGAALTALPRVARGVRAPAGPRQLNGTAT